MAASEKKAILLFLEHRLEDYAYSNDYDQDREDRYIQTKDITYPERQGNNAQDKPETADLDAVEGADAHKHDYDQPCPDEPGTFGEHPFWRKPEATYHNQEKTPSEGV